MIIIDDIGEESVLQETDRNKRFLEFSTIDFLSHLSFVIC